MQKYKRYEFLTVAVKLVFFIICYFSKTGIFAVYMSDFVVIGISKKKQHNNISGLQTDNLSINTENKPLFSLAFP